MKGQTITKSLHLITDHIKIDREEICTISTRNIKQVVISKSYGDVGRNDGKKQTNQWPNFEFHEDLV